MENSVKFCLFISIVSALIICCFCSCSTITDNYAIKNVGSITIYNDDFTILKKYDNITISEEKYTYSNGITDPIYGSSNIENKVNIIKTNGINFKDNDTNKMYFISNSFKYIIEYETFYVNSNNDVEVNNTNQEDNDYVNEKNNFITSFVNTFNYKINGYNEINKGIDFNDLYNLRGEKITSIEQIGNGGVFVTNGKQIIINRKM